MHLVDIKTHSHNVSVFTQSASSLFSMPWMPQNSDAFANRCTALANPHILLVEDDPGIRQPLAEFLRGKGFVVSEADSVETAEPLLARGDVEVMLLDIMLPGEDGLDFCRRINGKGAPRIIMLTALGDSTDKVVGLELGADDYMTKPVDLRELVARIRAVLRRPSTQDAHTGVQPSGADGLVLHFKGFTFFPAKRFLRSDAGVRIPLTGTETDLLMALCQHPRDVLSRDELIGLTRGQGFPISARSIDLLISRLRRKLAGDDPLDDPIRTMRSDGYAFQRDVTPG
jgi:two-component system OmpR family response regulator